ncbi:MAG TPA: DUF3467 domain-containing protein [bacterium]|nr:DUF3467 domain-containing protein [bacterium]
MTESKELKQVNIEIQVDEQTAMGQYVNMAVAQHSPAEFVLDFVFLPPGQLKARVRSRVIMAPEHAKRLLKVLTDNIANYEKRFGEIKLPEPHPGYLPAPKIMQ